MKISYVAPKKPRTPPTSLPPFGSTFSSHMFIQHWDTERGWHDATIQGYQALSIEPAACVFHYGQEIFEGMKAYRRHDGGINLFRPLENMKRFNTSATRMAMPPIAEKDHLQAITELVKMDTDWIPNEPAASLYVRPTMIATEAYLGVHASTTYDHFIITSPVGAYHGGIATPMAVYVSTQYRRGVRGGTASVKAGGNYGASLIASEQAIKEGYGQVLWLDAITGKNVEEVGTSNVFFVYKNKRLVTPKLSGSILPGITRDSILTLAKTNKYDVTEAVITIDEVVRDILAKDISEVFTTGTAAVISPVGMLGYNNEKLMIHENKTGPVTQEFFEELTEIQYGTKPDPFGWILQLN